VVAGSPAYFRKYGKPRTPQELGLIISPRPFIQQLLEDGKLLCVLPEYRTWPERRLWAVFPPNRYMSTRLRLFMDHMHAYCRNTFPQ
jgi:DNA-binding transcriptional LysR family regulator